MIQHINRLVFEASSTNRYATFFWAQYEPAVRRLRFVNAGHNPPIVYRKRPECEQVFRLEDGGTVLGLFPSWKYSEATLQLEAGDIFVAFTDGISEAMSGNDGVWRRPAAGRNQDLRGALRGRHDHLHPRSCRWIYRRHAPARRYDVGRRQASVRALESFPNQSGKCGLLPKTDRLIKADRLGVGTGDRETDGGTSKLLQPHQRSA
jgi:hypothetical protein